MRRPTSAVLRPSRTPNNARSARAPAPGRFARGEAADASEERVDEGCDTCDLSDEQQHPEDQQRRDEWQQPPQAPRPQEMHEFANRARSRRHVSQDLHTDLLVTNTRSSTNASIPLRWNVLTASAGVLTIGSPRRLNDVLSSTGTP